MADDIAALVAQADLPAIASSFTATRKRGAEYIAKCVFHQPDKNPSLSLFHKGGKWQFKCFSCGEQGDALDWIEKLEGLDTVQAIKRLGGGASWPARIVAPAERPALPERITSKPPPDAAAPDMAIRALGEPARIWPYRDADGAVLGYVARYDTPEGKQIRCWTWGARGDEPPKWGCGHWNAPRPLYGLEKLAARPEAQTLVVEGEKAADAATALLPAYVVLTWPGGSNAWHKADWSPLRGRKALLWPDNDAAGLECMAKLAALLADPRGLACTVRMIDPNRMPDGFDAADWTGTTEELIAWAKPRAKDYAPPAPQQPEAPKKPARPKLAAVDGNTVRAPAPDTEALPAPMSEDALADHFADVHGQDWRHVREWGQWFKWSEDRWSEDRTFAVERLAVLVTRSALHWSEAALLTPKERRQVSRKSTAWAIRDLAATDRRIAATVDQWDREPLLLGVPGGVVDLRTGDTLAADREQYISKQTAIAPAAGTPHKWLEYLNRVHAGNTAIIGYLQRYAGYCCTGDTKEHALAFLYGTGRNGKGVFLETISRILGDYARTASMDTFMEQKHAAHSTELARLHGARLVITEEAASGGKWNEARIKHITGGGKITAHFMRQDDFEFTPTFKLLIAANHKPMLRAVDEAIKARIHLVPFKVTIPPEERDKNLLEKLEAEWPQILAWMLEGCSEWQRNGLQVPSEILDATDQYVESEDVLGAWLEECCVRDHRMEGAAGYKNYSEWCERQGERVQSRRGWSNALIERGFEPCKGTGGARMFAGVSLKFTH